MWKNQDLGESADGKTASLQVRKGDEFSHRNHGIDVSYIGHRCTRKVKKAAKTEMKQLHDRLAFTPISIEQLTNQEFQRQMEILLVLALRRMEPLR